MASSMSISGVPVVAVATSAPLQVRSFLNVDETVGWLGDTTSPLSSAGSISPPERSGVLPLSLASTSASPGAGIRRKENASPTGGEPRSPVGALDDTQRNMPIMLDGSMMNAEEQTSLVAVPRMFLNPDDIVAAAPPQQSNPTSRPSRKDAPVILFEPAEASDHPTPNSTTAAMAAGSKNGAKQTSPIKMMLRVTKSKFSCIRHCCPVDNAFFSSKKEFDLWNDVLKNATKELWDGENVSLMLHGAAQNMSLFDLTSQATDPMTVGPSSVSPVSSESAPGAEKEGTSPSSPKSAVSRSQTPDGGGGGGGAKKKVAPVAGNSKRLSTNGATKPKTRKSTHGAAGGHHHGALENILQALLVEVKHREVPLHYSAHVAVGACILLGNGEISDIAPQALVVDEPFTQHVEVEQPTATRGGKFGNKLKGGINNNNSNSSSPAGSTTTVPPTTSKKGFPATSGGLPPSSPTASAGSPRANNNGVSHAFPNSTQQDATTTAAGGASLDEADTDTLVDHTGAVVRMRMFPVASLDDIEEFAAHISPVCALHMRREQQDAAAAAAAAVLGLSSSNVAAGGKVTGATQAAADPSSTPSESESVTPATGRSPRDHSAGPFNVETLDPTSGGGRQNKANHNNGNHHHAAGGHQPTVLLISVQLRQSCSLVSKPRTSYIRIVQLIRAPSVVEDVLTSVSTGKPLPVFASHVAKVIKQRIQEATQIVFVQSCVPATALEVLPAIAAAKGAVVKTELAAVAEDIVQASQMFLDTRQKLREQLKLLKEEFKSLRQTYHGKERELRRASMVGVDMTAGGGMDPIAAAAAVAAQQRAEKIAAAAAAAMQLPKAAADHLTKHNRPANIDILAGMTFKSEEDVAAGEEAVLAFKEQANIEKQDAEREIEGQQKELGTHGDKVLQLRRQMDDLKKKLQTSTYEHAMGMRDLRQVLEQDFQQLQRGTTATQHNNNTDGSHLESSANPARHTTVSMVRQLRLSAGGTASKSKVIASCGGGNSTTLLSTSAQPSRILMMATSQLSTSALSNNTTTAGTTTLAVLSPGSKSRAVKTAQQLRSDNSSMERFLADLIRQRNEKQQILDKAVVTLDKKRRTQENTTELCERHVAALRDYCMDLYAVFKHVEHQARLTHSVDDALAASQLEAYEGVQHVDQRLIRMPREAL